MKKLCSEIRTISYTMKVLFNLFCPGGTKMMFELNLEVTVYSKNSCQPFLLRPKSHSDPKKETKVISHIYQLWYHSQLSDALILLLHDLHGYRWLGLIGQFRPKKLISSIKAEFSTNDDMEVPTFKDVAKHVLDKSLYSFGLCTQLLVAPSSSIKFSTEGHGEKKGRRNKFMLFHKACISLPSFNI